VSGGPQLEELLAPFAGWMGRWEGAGEGLWAADQPFRYHEILVIEDVPDRALLRFLQQSTVASSGASSHSELGFIRLLAERQVELLVSGPAGYVEIHTGQLVERELNFRMHTLGVSPGARPLRAVERRMVLDGDTLRSSIAIAVDAHPPSPHVASSLRRRP